jgi:hypothetical protein
VRSKRAESTHAGGALRAATNSTMSHDQRISRSRSSRPSLVRVGLTATAALTGALGFSRHAEAEPRPVGADSAEQCLSAYSEGQRARKGGEFRKARDLLAQCGGPSCPTALHGDCQRWLSEVESATPRAVFRVLSAKGDEIPDVQLAIDDGPREALDGRAIEFDPGEHWLEFRAVGYQSLRRKQAFVEGEKLASHTVQLKPLPTSGATTSQPASEASLPEPTQATSSPAPEASRSGTNLPVWLGVGVAAVGGAGFAYFGLAARRDEKALASCSPNCTSARVADVEQEYLLANVSLGVGVAGLLGAAAWLVFDGGEASSDETTASGWALRFTSTSASISGRF